MAIEYLGLSEINGPLVVLEGVKNAILTAVKDAGPNACPPMEVSAA